MTDRAYSQAVHEILGNGEMAGRDLRAELSARVGAMTAPGFYAMMARLESEGMAQGWYAEKTIDGLIVRERWYRR